MHTQWLAIGFICLSTLAILPPLSYSQTPAPPSTTNDPVTIPAELRRGHLYIHAPAKGLDKPLFIMLDTGFTINTLRPDFVDQLGLQRSGRTRLMGISGQEEAPVYRGITFTFGGLTYEPRRTAALPSDQGSREDGIFGASFFRRFVVEIDGKQVRLHEPATFHYQGSGEIIPLKLRRETPIIEATLPIPDREPIKAQFELDTGCTGALCLGSTFVQTNNLLEAAGKTAGGERRGIGGGTGIREGHLPELRLGNLKVANPSTSFFTSGSPAEKGMAGHIGWDALRKFKVILDYSRQQLILEPLSFTKN